jgi:hypothetical protein
VDTTYTVVYLDARRMPKVTSKMEIEARDAIEALSLFINLPGMQNEFVACVVAGPKSSVYFTLES